MSNKKELPADWLVYIAEKEREIKQAPNPLKSHRPHVQRHESRRQRTAGSQTNNFVHAVYQEDSAPTPLAKPGFVGTRDIGGNCEDRNSLSGKATGYRAYEGRGEQR